jgi:hypothetical protein
MLRLGPMGYFAVMRAKKCPQAQAGPLKLT